jgi:adenine deaminase
MADGEIYGLGEMMNFPGVLAGDVEVHRKLAAARGQGKPVTGHYSMPETGNGLNAYAASGISCCHESVRAEDALAKMRLGMYAQIREGSAWRDLHEVIRCITEGRVDTRFACLVSDDTHPNTLLESGHLDHILRRAISEGVDPVTAIQMVTINTAHCYGMERDHGSISPGKLADIVLMSDLANVKVEKVFKSGRLVAEGGRLAVALEPRPCPDYVKNTMHLPKRFTAGDFAIQAPVGAGATVRARVIRAVEAKVGTLAETRDFAVDGGFVRPDPEAGVNMLAVVERHRGTGETGKGFVSGLGLKRGAIASTVAHDAHNLMIVGADEGDMAAAANALLDCGGGMAAVLGGKTIALLPLPVAGLMCEESCEEVDKKVRDLDAAWKALGCDMISPYMTTALLSLAVLPELRLTNKGLIDTVSYRFTELFC